MSEFKKEQVSRAFMAKLYESLTARPDIEAEALPEDQFIAWAHPGLPFLKEDFLFATRGIGGGAGEGEDVRQRILHAAEWSRLVNFIPDPNGIYDESQQKRMFDNTAFAQDGKSLLSVYRNVLNFSQVAASELSEEEVARLERWRGLLVERRQEEDLITGEMREIVDDSPLIKAYNTFMEEYIDAALLYNGKRINALNSADGLAVQDWALNEDLYRHKVQSAYNKWVSAGRKNDVETIRASIDQITRRNLALLKAQLLDDLDRSKINDSISGLDFYWTSLIPASLPFADSWETKSFSHSEVKTHEEKNTNQWEVEANIPIYSFVAKPSTSGSIEKYEKEVDTSDFSMTYQIAQAIVSCPVIDWSFVLSNAWRFPEDVANLTDFTRALSDGAKPAQGALVAYPTTAIFVRDVQVDFKELHEETSEFKRDIEAGLSLSFGPIRLGKGKYKHGHEERDFESQLTKEGLKVPGLQLIGFKCKLLPQLPNPSEAVEEWV